MSAAALLADCQKRLERLRGGGGWFTSGGGQVDHGTYRSVIGQYHDRVFHEGRVAWAALVLAQPVLYGLGDWDSTGTVVYSYDRQYDANPQHLERIAASVGALKNAMPKDALLVTFAAEVRNDSPREIDRLVPVALTQGRQVRYETIYIQRHRLPVGYLVAQFFPVIISTSQPTQPMLLPLEAWSPELVQAWQDAARKKPPTAAPVQRTDHRSFDQAYNESAAKDSLQFGQGSGQPGNNGAYGMYGASGGQSAGYVDPYTTPANTYGAGRSYDGGAHAYVPATNSYSAPAPAKPHVPAPPPPIPVAPAPVRATPRLDPAAEAFARSPLQLTPAAVAGLRLCAKQQSMEQIKVRVSSAETGHRLDFVAGETNPTTDFVYDSGGVTVVVDVASARNLTSAQVDFGPSPVGVGFFFRRVA